MAKKISIKTIFMLCTVCFVYGMQIPVYEDGIVDSFTPTDVVWNYRNYCRIGYDSLSSRSYRGWFKFDISSVPKEKVISQVKVCVFVYARKNEPIDMYSASNIIGISEQNAVWNTPPQPEQLLVGNVSLNPTEQISNYWKITFSSPELTSSVINSIQNSDYYWGCVLKEKNAGVNGFASMYTRENSNDVVPYIEIVFCGQNIYDFNDDCVVNFDDLLIMCENWLEDYYVK